MAAGKKMLVLPGGMKTKMGCIEMAVVIRRLMLMSLQRGRWIKRDDRALETIIASNIQIINFCLTKHF